MEQLQFGESKAARVGRGRYRSPLAFSRQLGRASDFLNIPRVPGEQLERSIARAFRVAQNQAELVERGWVRIADQRRVQTGGSASGSGTLAVGGAFRGFRFHFPDGTQYVLPDHAAPPPGPPQQPRRLGALVVGGAHGGWASGSLASSGRASLRIPRILGGAPPVVPRRSNLSYAVGERQFDGADIEALEQLRPIPIQSPASNVGEFASKKGMEEGDGTATIVGPRVALTAAHALWDTVGRTSRIENGWSTEFFPHLGPGVIDPVEVDGIGFDSRWKGDEEDHGFDLAVAILADNPFTALSDPWPIMWVGLPESFYEPRVIGAFGYPLAEGVAYAQQQCHMAFGGFRGFASDDVATYGNFTEDGMSGGPIAAFSNGLGGADGVAGVSFVHVGTSENAYFPYATTTKDGVRLSVCKGYGVLRAICDHPSQYVDISEGCDYFPEECGF